MQGRAGRSPLRNDARQCGRVAWVVKRNARSGAAWKLKRRWAHELGIFGRRLGEAPGRQCGPKAIQALRRSPTGHLRHEGASSPRRPALPLPLSGRRKLDHAALPPPGNPPTSCGAHSRRAASSRGPRAWVHVQCTRCARAVYKQSRAVHARKRVRLGASSAGGRLT